MNWQIEQHSLKFLTTKVFWRVFVHTSTKAEEMMLCCTLLPLLKQGKKLSNAPIIFLNNG